MLADQFGFSGVVADATWSLRLATARNCWNRRDYRFYRRASEQGYRLQLLHGSTVDDDQYAHARTNLQLVRNVVHVRLCQITNLEASQQRAYSRTSYSSEAAYSRSLVALENSTSELRHTRIGVEFDVNSTTSRPMAIELHYLVGASN